jgi:hypothetical protein
MWLIVRFIVANASRARFSRVTLRYRPGTAAGLGSGERKAKMVERTSSMESALCIRERWSTIANMAREKEKKEGVVGFELQLTSFLDASPIRTPQQLGRHINSDISSLLLSLSLDERQDGTQPRRYKEGQSHR